MGTPIILDSCTCNHVVGLARKITAALMALKMTGTKVYGCTMVRMHLLVGHKYSNKQGYCLVDIVELIDSCHHHVQVGQ